MPWTEPPGAIMRAEGSAVHVISAIERALIAPFLPEPRPIGRSRTTDLREVVNAILYLASSGCAWSLLPREFPPYTTG